MSNENININAVFSEKEQPFIFFAGLAASIFWKSLKFIAPIAFLVFIPVNIASALIYRGTENIEIISSGIINEAALQLLYPRTLMSAALNGLFVPIVTMSAASVVKHIFEKKRLTFQSVLDDSLFQWWKLVITLIIFAAIIFLSAILIVLPVYFCIIFNFYIYVIVFSGKWGISALKHSKELVKKRFLKTVGYLLLIFFIGITISMLVNTIMSVFPASVQNGYITGAIIASVSQLAVVYLNFVAALWYKNWDLYRRDTQTHEGSAI